MATKEEVKEWFAKFADMSLDDVAVEAAYRDSVHAHAAKVEMDLRVAKAQVKAAEAQQKTASAQRITAWGTLVLIAATLIVAWATYLTVN